MDAVNNVTCAINQTNSVACGTRKRQMNIAIATYVYHILLVTASQLTSTRVDCLHSSRQFNTITRTTERCLH